MLKQNARLLKSMGNETRLKIFQALLVGELCCCTLTKIAGRAQSTVSTHLNDLERQGLLNARRDGRNIFYSIKDERIFKILDVLEIEAPSVLESICKVNY